MNWKRDFDWAGAIERHSEALKGIIEALFAMLGLDGDAVASRIPRSVHSAVLLVLRPAESAVRRLIVVAARGVVVKPFASRPISKGQITGKGGGSRLPAFKLFDTRKRFAELGQRRGRPMRNPPRIRVLDWYDPRVPILRPAPEPAPVVAPVSPPDGLVSAQRLTRRLQALKLALDDLPRQAKRLARARLRREKVPRLRFQSPLRPGRAPGYRRRHIHPIDEVLAECHALAWEAEKPDTS